MDDVSDELMLDEELEGDIGSDFEGDAECFPSEWTIVDDADDDDFVEMSVAEDNSANTKKDDSGIKKEEESSHKESTEKPKEKSQDAKLKDGKPKPQDKKSDIISLDNKHDTPHRSTSQSQDKKTRSISGDKKPDSTSVKKTDPQMKNEHITSSNITSKSPVELDPNITNVKTDMKVAVKQELTKEKQESAPVATEEKSVAKTRPKEEISKEMQTQMAIPIPVHPLPRNSSKLNESYLFNAARQSTRCRLVTGGDDTPPAILPCDSESTSSITWGMRIYPFFGKDLALKEMVKIVNIADHFAVFVLFGKLPKCGDISLLLHHHNDVKIILIKLFHTEMTASDLNVFVNRRKDDGTYETGELKLNLSESKKLDTNLAYRMGPDGKGKPENRSIKVQNIPEGTSKKMMEVLFPISHSITFCELHKGDKTGSATIEFLTADNARQVTECYKELKLGDNILTLSFTGKPAEKKKVEEKVEEKTEKAQEKSTVTKSEPKQSLKREHSSRDRSPLQSRNRAGTRDSKREIPKRDSDRRSPGKVRSSSARSSHRDSDRNRGVRHQQERDRPGGARRWQDQQAAPGRGNPTQAPGILGPAPDALEMNDLLPVLPKGLALGEKQRMMVIELQQQKLKQQLQQQQQMQLQQQQLQLQQQQQIQMQQFEMPHKGPVSENDRDEGFIARHEGLMGDRPPSGQLAERGAWPQEPKMSRFDRNDDDRRRFEMVGDDRFPDQEQRFGQMSSGDQQELPPRSKRTKSRFDRPSFQDDAPFKDRSPHDRPILEPQGLLPDPGNRYLLTQEEERSNRELNWNAMNRNEPDQNVFLQERIRERERLSRDPSDFDIPIREENVKTPNRYDRRIPEQNMLEGEMMGRDMPRRDMPVMDLSGHNMPHRELIDHDMPRRELLGHDMPHRDLPMHDIPQRDLPGRDIPPRDLPVHDVSGRDLPSRDLADRDFGRNFDNLQQDEARRQMQDYSKLPSSGVDRGQGLFGNIREYDHGSKPVKRQSRFEPEEPTLPKRTMPNNHGDSSNGFTGGPGGLGRQPQNMKPPPKPLHEIVVHPSADIYRMQQQEQQQQQQQQPFNRGPDIGLPQQQQQADQQEDKQHLLQKLMQQQMMQATGRFLQKGTKR